MQRLALRGSHQWPYGRFGAARHAASAPEIPTGGGYLPVGSAPLADAAQRWAPRGRRPPRTLAAGGAAQGVPPVTKRIERGRLSPGTTPARTANLFFLGRLTPLVGRRGGDHADSYVVTTRVGECEYHSEVVLTHRLRVHLVPCDAGRDGSPERVSLFEQITHTRSRTRYRFTPTLTSSRAAAGQARTRPILYDVPQPTDNMQVPGMLLTGASRLGGECIGPP